MEMIIRVSTTCFTREIRKLGFTTNALLSRGLIKHFVKVFTHLVSWAQIAFPYHQAWQEWLYGIVSFFELFIQKM